MTATRQELLAAASGLHDLLDAEAEASDDYGHMTTRAVDALHEAGLMHLALPKDVGGDDADLVTQVLVYEALSAAEGSAGWSHMAGATATAFCAAFMDDEAVAQIFQDDRGMCAGQFAPVGTFEAVEGGYLVTGAYSFASGSNHARYLTAGGTVLRDGEMAFKANGMPEMRVAAIPRDEVDLRGNWHVLGLQGTGSQDYAVDRVFVPEGRTFDLFSAEPARGGPQFGIGVMPMTSAGHAGWALGVTRRALDEIAEIAQAKERLGKSIMAIDPVFQTQFGQHTAMFRAARAYVIEAFGDIQQAADRGVDDAELLRLKGHVRVATTWCTNVGSEVVTWAYRMAGSQGLRDGSAMQRCFRDIHAGTQHIFVDDSTYQNAAKVWLGHDDGFVFL